MLSNSRRTGISFSHKMEEGGQSPTREATLVATTESWSDEVERERPGAAMAENHGEGAKGSSKDLPRPSNGQAIHRDPKAPRTAPQPVTDRERAFESLLEIVDRFAPLLAELVFRAKTAKDHTSKPTGGNTPGRKKRRPRRNGTKSQRAMREGEDGEGQAVRD